MRRNDPYKPNRPKPVRPNTPAVTRAPKTNVAAKAEKRLEAGPRPLSPQQRAYQNLTMGRPDLQEPLFVLPVPQPIPVAHEGRRVRARRDATISRKKVVLNRRRPNYPPIILRFALVGFAVEILAALSFSPRLSVKTIDVVGNVAIPKGTVLALGNQWKGQNLFRFPLGKLHDAVQREPTFERVDVSRVWPDAIKIVVVERKPWASVTTHEGVSYTIDNKWVPFRKTPVPEVNLPHLTLALSSQGKPSAPVLLGKKMNLPGLSEVDACLAWAKARKDFPLESVSIDPTGKLCFNRVGGTQVQLGSATNLPQKLNALTLLMQRENIDNAAYINLFAYDAPAIMPKHTVTTASSLTHTSKSSSPSHPESTPVDSVKQLEQP